MRKNNTPKTIKQIEWPRSDPAELAKFDPRTKACTMNCGSSRDDPRSDAESKFQCDDCITVEVFNQKGKEMQGTKLTKIEGEEDFLFRISETAGAYGTTNGKDWFCTTPNGLLGSLRRHSVTEHEDGTITVSPSILVTSGSNHADPRWHGYLERGVWREC